jgi:hypothetical protein
MKWCDHYEDWQTRRAKETGQIMDYEYESVSSEPGITINQPKQLLFGLM